MKPLRKLSQANATYLILKLNASKQPSAKGELQITSGHIRKLSRVKEKQAIFHCHAEYIYIVEPTKLK